MLSILPIAAVWCLFSGGVRLGYLDELGERARNAARNIPMKLVLYSYGIPEIARNQQHFYRLYIHKNDLQIRLHTVMNSNKDLE